MLSCGSENVEPSTLARMYYPHSSESRGVGTKKVPHRSPKPASRGFRDVDNDAKTPEVGFTSASPRIKNVVSGDLLPLAGIPIPKSVMKMIKIYSVSQYKS